MRVYVGVFELALFGGSMIMNENGINPCSFEYGANFLNLFCLSFKAKIGQAAD